MLTRRNTDSDINNQGTQSEYYADSLLQKPGYFHSAFDNLAAGFATPPVAAAILDKQYAQSPEGQAMTSTLSAVELENETPGLGWPQKVSNTVASMVGFALNPMTYLLGGAGGIAARGVVSAATKIAPDAATIFMRKPIKDLLGQSIGKYLPSIVGKEGTEEPLSASLIADKSLHAFGNFAGFSVPQAIVDNYEQDTSHISWGGVAREAGEMGAFGIAIGSIPFTWGVLRGKINRGLGKETGEAITPATLSEGLAKGHITQSEHDWYKDYLETKGSEEPKNITLYRGEGKNRPGGIWYTKDINQAKMYAKGQEGKVFSVKVTQEDLDHLFEAGDVGTNNEHYKFLGTDEQLEEKINKKRYVHDEDMMASLRSRSSQIANENGHTASTVSNEALFEMLTPENMKNLQGVIADQLAGDVPERYKTALSDFVVHNRLDEIRQNPKDLDGVRGYVDFINQKLEDKNPKLAEADKILDDHLLKGVNESMPLSQKELFKKLKGSNLAAHVTHLPLSVPENVIDHLKQLGEIKRIERLNKNIFKDYEKTGNPKNVDRMKQNEAKIKQLQENLTPILSAKEEMQQLRRTLLGEKGLPPNWEHSPAYHRLIDLSSVSHNARTLLDRVHLEHEYNRQTAFRDLSSHILKVADSDMGRLAKPDSVIDYMKSRIEGKLQKVEPISETKKILDDQQKLPADPDTILNEQELQLQNTKAEAAKDEFVNATDKFKEFKQSEGIFKNFISCVIGGLSGQGK